jgi:hypothetical protein
MMALSENREQLNAAIDKMAAGLDGWEAQTAGGSKEQDPPYGRSVLLSDEAAAIPVLPLAAYADGFARLRRGEYRDAVVSLRRAAAAATDERSELAAPRDSLKRDAMSRRSAHSVRSSQRDRSRPWRTGGWAESTRTSIGIADARKEYETVVPFALTGQATLLRRHRPAVSH